MVNLLTKTALITGASSGIGRESAFVYAKNEYDLIVVARRKENLESLKADIENLYKVKVYCLDIDLSEIGSATLLYDKVRALGLKPEVIINNAGFAINGQFKDIDEKREEEMLILNMITLTKITKYFLKDMLQGDTPGYIINIASNGAFQGVPGFATYAASKAYVLHFTEALAEELKNTKVKAIAICPGPTKSEFAATAYMSNTKMFEKVPEASDLAKFIFDSMSKSKTTRIHGFKNRLQAFGQRFAPRQLVTRIAGKVIS
jgi:uncharacterized protein